MNNTVELLGFYGSDEVIACSAWTSTSRELSEDKVKRIPALIDMLWSNGHETPFEKATVHFLVNCDIASHIHLLKHRMASINAESARYKELKEDKFYLPKDWNGILCTENVYPEILPYGETEVPFAERGESEWLSVLKNYTYLGNQLYHQCLEDLTPILGRKRAKESARFFKTYNSQIQADVMFNMRSFANFLKLRNSEHAQVEIREIAQEMLSLVQNIEGNPFEQTIKSIIKNGKSN
jgi:thymidylate synthase (FAD)